VVSGISSLVLCALNKPSIANKALRRGYWGILVEKEETAAAGGLVKDGDYREDQRDRVRDGSNSEEQGHRVSSRAAEGKDRQA